MVQTVEKEVRRDFFNAFQSKVIEKADSLMKSLPSDVEFITLVENQKYNYRNLVDTMLSEFLQTKAGIRSLEQLCESYGLEYVSKHAPEMFFNYLKDYFKQFNAEQRVIRVNRLIGYIKNYYRSTISVPIVLPQTEKIFLNNAEEFSENGIKELYTVQLAGEFIFDMEEGKIRLSPYKDKSTVMYHR